MTIETVPAPVKVVRIVHPPILQYAGIKLTLAFLLRLHASSLQAEVKKRKCPSPFLTALLTIKTTAKTSKKKICELLTLIQNK